MSEDEIQNPVFEEFDQQDADSIVELVNLGEITEDFEFCGHTFGLKTLRTDEEIAVGAALRSYDWDETHPKSVQLYATAHIGMALTHIDGDDTFCPPVGPNKTTFAKGRLKWLSEEYYWPVINYLYERYADLLAKQKSAVEAAKDF